MLHITGKSAAGKWGHGPGPLARGRWLGPCVCTSSALTSGKGVKAGPVWRLRRHAPGLPPCVGTVPSCPHLLVAFSGCQEPGVAGTQRLGDAGTWGHWGPGSRARGHRRMRGCGKAGCTLPVFDVLARTRGDSDGHLPGHGSTPLPRDDGPRCGFATRAPPLTQGTGSGVVWAGASLF